MKIRIRHLESKPHRNRREWNATRIPEMHSVSENVGGFNSIDCNLDHPGGVRVDEGCGSVNCIAESFTRFEEFGQSEIDSRENNSDRQWNQKYVSFPS
jgi:hypothetical protein